MSSSRSIAAARNRRAGEQQPTQTRSGPGTSIASQAAFVQQMNQDQRAMGGRNQMPQRQMNQQQPQVAPLSNGIPKGVKLSISDAIGLITLRLGKVEQFIMQLDNEILPSLKGESNISDNTQQIDRSVINSVVNRLDALEKSQKEILSGNFNLNKDNKDNNDNEKFEKEIRDIKDALMMQIVKYDKFSDSTNNKITDIHQRLTDIDNAFVEFENQFSIQGINDESIINDNNSNIISDNLDDNDDSSSNLNLDNTISSVDLKSIIKEQLKEL